MYVFVMHHIVNHCWTLFYIISIGSQGGLKYEYIEELLLMGDNDDRYGPEIVCKLLLFLVSFVFSILIIWSDKTSIHVVCMQFLIVDLCLISAPAIFPILENIFWTEKRHLAKWHPIGEEAESKYIIACQYWIL